MNELTTYEKVQLGVLLLDKIDEYKSRIDGCYGEHESDFDLTLFCNLRINELKTIYNKL